MQGEEKRGKPQEMVWIGKSKFFFSGTPPMVDLLVPPPEDTGPGKLTVGKVYGGMLILENWKLSRFGQGFNTNKGLPVSSSQPPLALYVDKAI